MPPNTEKPRVTRLGDARVRRLERRIERVEARLDESVALLIRLVRIVAVLHDRTKATSARVGGRVDRLTQAVGRGRTMDVSRLARLERRLEALERDVSR